MKLTKRTWTQDEGSIDLIQLFVGLLIISIASIGTFSSLFYGYEQLDGQMRYRKALTIARGCAEYWQGRIHVDFNRKHAPTMAGNLGNPEEYLLDERDPTTDYDNIYCEVAYKRINPVSFQEVVIEGVVDEWYHFNVVVTWQEPNDGLNALHEIELHAAMVPANL